VTLKPAPAHIDSTPAIVPRGRWRRFRSLRRGWYSFLLLGGAYVLSFALPLLVGNRALVVSYGGELRFPVFEGHIEASEFGQRVIGEARYRDLRAELAARGAGDWVVLPPYPYDPNESLLTDPALGGPPPHAPSARHWFGTDDRARDVFARLVYGFRISMTFGLTVVGLAYGFGTIAGALLGFLGGRVDIYGQRCVEIWAGLPFLYTIIIISSIVKPGPWTLAFALAAFTWTGITFYVRGEFYREKSRDYVAAAIAQGESRRSVMFRHILPNAVTPIVSFAPFAVVGSIVALVSLDFLGFGLQPPTPSWGELVNQGRENIKEWHLVLFPLGALCATLMMIVFVGEAVREAFAPRRRARLR